VPLEGGAIREVDLIEWDLAPEPDTAIEDAPMPAAVAGHRPVEPDHDASDATLPAERMAPAQRRRAEA
jgi:alpha-mannosidase